MANVKLDFSKMKHVSTDDHSTVLKHPDGHEIRLAHKSLSPENQKALSALASLSRTPDQAATQRQQMAPMFKGGPAPSINSDTMKMADGGDAGATGSKIARAVNASPTPYEITQSPRSYVDDAGAAASSPPGADEAFAAHMRQNEAATATETDATAQNAAAQGYRQMNAQGGDVKENKLDYSTFKQEKKPLPQGPSNTLNYEDLRRQKKEINRRPMADGGEICKACGGKIHYSEGGSADDGSTLTLGLPGGGRSQPKPAPKMYADEQDQPVSPDDNAPSADQPGPTYKGPLNSVPDYRNPANIPTESNIQQAKTDETRKLYNQAVNFAPGDPTYKNDMMIGPNGEPPVNPVPSAWDQAKKQKSQEDAQNAANATAAQQAAIAKNKALTDMGYAPGPIPNVPVGEQVPGSEIAAETGKTPDQPPPPPGAPDPLTQSMQNSYDMMHGGYQKALAGISEQATATGNLGTARADALQAYHDSQTTALSNYQHTFQSLTDERNKFIQDYQNGYIDPNKYWTGDAQGNGSHSKITAGIGMILAGFNPSNKPNAAIDFLKYQMDKNIYAQSQNLNAKHNLLAANMAQFGNIKDALNMTHIMQSDMMQAQLQQAAANAATPMAAAAAKQASGQLSMDTAPKFQQFAMQRSMMNMANQGTGNPGAIEHMLGYMRVVNPEMAKEMESRYVPGVGMSPSTPVPTEVRDRLIAQQQLDTMAKDLLNYSQTHTNINPMSPEYRTGVAKAQALQQMYRQATFGGIMRQGEQPMLDKILNSNPADAFKSLNSIPQLKTMIQTNSLGFNNLKKGYGLPQTPVQSEPVLRKTQDGKTAMFDPNTRQFLGYK